MNKRISNVYYSGIRKFFDEVKKYKDAVSLTVGQPDFELPKPIKEGIVRALNEGKTAYTVNQGIEELRERISSYIIFVNV